MGSMPEQMFPDILDQSKNEETAEKKQMTNKTLNPILPQITSNGIQKRGE